MLFQHPAPIRVGVISDDATLAPLLASVLGTDFAAVEVLASEPGEEVASAGRADALLLDFERGSLRTKEWTRRLRDGLPPDMPPVILMASDDGRRAALELVESGAYACVRKPPVIRELRAALRSAYERRSLRGELAAVRQRLETAVGVDQLTGSSAAMQSVYKLIRKVANLDASVLITGESGTGKELIARAIHNVGNRSRRPFVAVSCGAIPENLIEAELFGHEKGAFTGSIGAREGYFEKAGDGTLFLDEIGELNLATQVKLLRALQEREFSRLGSSRTVPLRARVLFATHRDLEQMVADKIFRQDLYYRVHVMTIMSPALREHMEDIPQLAHHFLSRYSELYGKPLEGIEPEALALLQHYAWPGNVRELENVIQRAIIMTEERSVGATDLPEILQDQDPGEYESEPPSGSFERLLRDYKFKLASEAVQRCSGNKTLAAQSLCISRAYLHRLLRPLPAGAESSVAEIGSRDSAFTLAAGQ